MLPDRFSDEIERLRFFGKWKHYKAVFPGVWNGLVPDIFQVIGFQWNGGTIKGAEFQEHPAC